MPTSLFPMAVPRSAPEARPATVPVEVAERLRAQEPSLAQDVLRELQRAVPAYAEPLPGRFRPILTGAIAAAVGACLDNLCGRTGKPDWPGVFRHLGQMEFLAGRTTDPMQTAIRIGARVVWQRISDCGLCPDLLVALPGAMFAWVDAVSTVAVDGYHEAQAKAQAITLDVRERSRRNLTRAILSTDPGTKEWIDALAEAAHWPLPEHLVAIVVERRGPADTLSDVGARQELLIDEESEPPCVLLPDPGRDRTKLAELLGGRRAAVGPVVVPAEAGRSLALARRMLGLQQVKAMADDEIAWCTDHLTTLLLLVDPFLTAQLREHTNAVFAGLTPRQRDRMATTLLAWLHSRGTHNEIAAQLDVHPQTLRYRIAQLQQLFGDRLTDPDARLTLELALRAHMLLTPQQSAGTMTE